MNEPTFCVLMTTTANIEDARELASGLVVGNLAACVQMQNITSIYEWKGAVQDEPEILLYIKTSTSRYDDVANYIAKNHKYDEPELVRVDITGGSTGYLNWVLEQTT